MNKIIKENTFEINDKKYIILGIKNAVVNNEIFQLNKKFEFQMINADYIATIEHIKHAILQAMTKKNISNNFWVEILVRASATRQIATAIKLLGAKSGDVCLICNDEETANIIIDKIGGIVQKNSVEFLDVPNDVNNEKFKKIVELYGLKNVNSSKELVKRVLEEIAIIECKV
ncbi:KEOPS complex subunit Cgi121 [Methanococcus voltae]|uniref:KEOPS complex Cgi121-like subunit n=1 Tax=Methanococcus voltae (strain ATCC BAA-1334 / A3) TaxID=456320 RepID=D7DRR0_METV3|nr:KEOPS complex subunit Cgi121 [Methanococcus voltae]MCS3901138.1 tRNA threonylcarbamoyladenosine modification (KEOPS) complex Cgi121 subunit [Methanococcus voltae]